MMRSWAFSRRAEMAGVEELEDDCKEFVTMGADFLTFVRVRPIFKIAIRDMRGYAS
jgi:hypothetical protein